MGSRKCDVPDRRRAGDGLGWTVVGSLCGFHPAQHSTSTSRQFRTNLEDEQLYLLLMIWLKKKAVSLKKAITGFIKFSKKGQYLVNITILLKKILSAEGKCLPKCIPHMDIERERERERKRGRGEREK